MKSRRLVALVVILVWSVLCAVAGLLVLDPEAWEDRGAAVAQDILLIGIGVVWLLVVLPSLVLLVLNMVEHRQN